MSFYVFVAVVFCRIEFTCVELQSFRIRMHPEFPALVVTGSWPLSLTLRAGSFGYLVSFLAMRFSILIIVVGASVSYVKLDVIN